jgi:hypothetical protein
MCQLSDAFDRVDRAHAALDVATAAVLESLDRIIGPPRAQARQVAHIKEILRETEARRLDGICDALFQGLPEEMRGE